MRAWRRRGVITSKRSALLWQVLTEAYARLGFDVIGDEAYLTLTLQENKARAVVAREAATGRRGSSRPRNGANELDETHWPGHATSWG
jgi:hypothetical protein